MSNKLIKKVTYVFLYFDSFLDNHTCSFVLHLFFSVCPLFFLYLSFCLFVIINTWNNNLSLLFFICVFKAKSNNERERETFINLSNKNNFEKRPKNIYKKIYLSFSLFKYTRVWFNHESNENLYIFYSFYIFILFFIYPN